MYWKHMILLALLGVVMCAVTYNKTKKVADLVITFLLICSSLITLLISNPTMNQAIRKSRFTYLIYALPTILLGIVSCTDYIKTRKIRKLIYPLFWAYWFVVMPILEKFRISNAIMTLYIAVGCVATFLYGLWDINITFKEKMN